MVHVEEEIDADDSQALMSDENEINIYYEPEEIEMNRANQNKDQFADLIQIRKYAIERRNKFNILDYMPGNTVQVNSTPVALGKSQVVNAKSTITRTSNAMPIKAAEDEIEFSDDEHYKQLE